MYHEYANLAANNPSYVVTMCPHANPCILMYVCTFLTRLHMARLLEERLISTKNNIEKFGFKVFSSLFRTK